MNPLVLSFGIGNDISFDLIVINKYGATVHAFDPTPISLAWLKTQTLPTEFHSHPVGLAAMDGEIEFGLPLQDGWDSFSVLDLNKGSVRLPVNSLSSISRNLDICSEDVDILKMDIEGSEFEVIDDISKIKYNPKQILVEFHYHHSVPASANDVIASVGKLRAMGYLVFDISPWGRECSLIRKDLIQR